MFDDRAFNLIGHNVTLIDDDEILFSDDLNKIMVLNETASCIWNSILKISQNSCVLDYSVIQEQLLREFDTSMLNGDALRKDIDAVLKTFVDEGFLILGDEE